ncbi:MAG: Rieske 2Fe-2S domain-containing protein [Alphaproteobacteria bacterium]|nr:Rieske 2Fe-2S domain-containing protein [Alphaproteobacteria bacterium]
MTPEENERLARIGPGTPAGNLMRRYWWPVWFSELTADKPVPVRLLGEDLVLFRDASGAAALLDRRCPHRGASLDLGRVEDDGLRCCYHGWKFAGDGRCLEMPAEPPGSPLVAETRTTAYPTQEAGGLVFAYLGPDPAPQLPRYDNLFRGDCIRRVSASFEQCNWMQRAENAVDQMHSIALHAAVYPEFALKRPEVDWQRTWYGVRAAFKVPDGAAKVSHFIFPSHSRYFGARVNEDASHNCNLRVPVDDVTTLTFSIRLREARGKGDELITAGLREVEPGRYQRVEDGWWGLASRDQDRACQESQGPIADRSREILGTSDRGVIMFRRMLSEAIDAVERGEDPPGILRGAGDDIITFDAQKIRDDGEVIEA